MNINELCTERTKFNKNEVYGGLISKIASSYDKHSSKEINRPDYLPDKTEVAEIITLLRKLLFPGYFDENDTDSTDTEGTVQVLVTEVEYKLRRQICRALNLDTSKDKDCSNMFGRAGVICDAFLQKIPELI